MPDFWETPSVSMGLAPIMAVYQARFDKYLRDRGLTHRLPRTWALVGDGEMEEPESVGALTVAARECLGNLKLLVSCNLQRLDGPVRGNASIVSELEGLFRGAGWRVVKVLWGRGWCELLARDLDGRLVDAMEGTVNGEWQIIAAEDGPGLRKRFFGRDSELASIARAVARSWSEIPHVTQGDRADVTALEAFRVRFAEEEGAPLSTTAILVAVVARALLRFPRVNAALDLEGDACVLRRYVHVGVAVDTEHGLLVPVVRDADRKSLRVVAEEIRELAKRARSRAVRSDEMEGAGFTVTNLGGLGTTSFTPIVSWPQIAILGVGRARLEPVHASELLDARSEDGFVARRVLPLVLSYDHRAIDGADAARFLRWICRALEEPMRLLG